VASTLGAHSSLCRHLNTSSKNIKQLNRLINTYLDQPDIDSRVLACGRAASDVSGTSLASPQKLNRVVVALKTIEDACQDDDEEMLSPVMNTDVLQKLIAEKTRHVKQVIKTSFEIDSLSLKHAKVSPTKRLIRSGRRGYKRTPSTVSRDGGGDGGGDGEEKQEKEKGEKEKEERNDELERRELKRNSSTTTTATRQRVHTSCIECMQSPRHLCVNCAAPAPGATEKKKSSDGGDTGGDSDPVMSLRRTYSTTHVNAPEELLDVRHSGHQPTCISDFQILKPISQGAFGSVYLVRKKKTGDLFA